MALLQALGECQGEYSDRAQPHGSGSRPTGQGSQHSPLCMRVCDCHASDI